MKSRIEKYYQAPSSNQRAIKNKELYQDINTGELEEFNLASNVSVLDNNANQIDVAKIREMLDYKYREEPKRKSIAVDIPKELKEEPDETREYDINTILQKARSEKSSDYEIDRLKKLRDTQYDILKKLDFQEEDESDSKTQEQKLLNLINTITEKEFSKKLKENIDPLDILTDLKGDENTKVIEPIELAPKVSAQTIKEVVKEEVQNQIDKSFFTNSTTFTQSDFDDFNDLKEDVKSSKLLIQILIVLILIALVVGFIVLLNSILNLGWF